jgi:glycosyltransferase involved in cell wall biosynthesis
MSLDYRRKKIVWLTNLPAPYRFSIWDRVSEKHELEVIFTHAEINSRNWTVSGRPLWAFKYLSKRVYKFGETDVIINPLGSWRVTNGAQVVVVGGWENIFYISALLISKIRKIRIVQFYESIQESRRFDNLFVNWIRFKVINLADYIITPGVGATKALLAMGISQRKIIQEFNVVDVDFFSSAIKLQQKSSLVGHNYLFVGRLIALKNVASLIRAFKLCKRSQDTLNIVGSGVLMEELSTIVEELNLRESVNFLGHLDKGQLLEIYGRSNTLVLPSSNEVWGLVVNEALSAGLHVVVSGACGVSSSVNELKGVYICDTSVKSIAEMMTRSREDYVGPVARPEILSYKPQNFADKLMELF